MTGKDEHETRDELRRASHPDEPLPEGEEAPPPGTRVMAVVRWALVLLMAVAAVASVGWYLGWFRGTAADARSAGTIWVCPMHPEVRQDQPGECPICSMTLVPRPRRAAAAGEHVHGAPVLPGPPAAPDAGPAAPGVAGLAPVTIGPERIQLIGMRTARATRKALAAELRTVGQVTANERGLAVIQTRFAGWIETLLVAQTGEPVARGQALATIYSPDLLAAQQEYLSALAWARPTDGGAAGLAAGLAGDARRRLELLGISPTELDAIERTGTPVRAMTIRSPVRGHVIEKAAVQGLHVEPGAPLFRVADLSTVWVLADVYEHEIGRVRAGLAARLELVAYPGESWDGKVTFLYPTIDPDTRTLRVRVELGNRGLRLKPGMYGDVTLRLAPAEGLVIPAEALVDTGVARYVFVALPGGRFEPRPVAVGARAADEVQVIEGLAEGDVVVTTGNFLIDSESRLAAAGAGAAAPADVCDTDFDRQKFPDKHQQCVACRAHRGMGTMEEDCRNAIPRPWK